MLKVCHVLSLLLIYSYTLSSQTSDLIFDQITTEDGLSSNTVFDVIQDHQGIMWFGTIDGGLNRYDGYTFKVYKNIPGDSTSLPKNRVEVLYEDHAGQLWIGIKTEDYAAMIVILKILFGIIPGKMILPVSVPQGLRRSSRQK